MFGIIGMMTCSPSSAQVDCELPGSIVLEVSGQSGNLLVTGTENGREAPLDEIGFLTKLKWSFGLLIPSLAAGEVGIHLYRENEAGFLAEYDNIEETRFVQFFLACTDGDGYVAIPATISQLSEDQQNSVGTRENQNDLYVGMTFRPQDTTPDATLKGDLARFSAAPER